MARTGTTPDERPLIDNSQPHGIARYATYRVGEVARLLGIGPDKVRSIFRDKAYGEVILVPSKRYRPHRKNYITLLIPYATLMNLLGGKSEVA